MCRAGALAREGDHKRLEEVVVTASKRAENLQDIPITVEAIPLRPEELMPVPVWRSTWTMPCCLRYELRISTDKSKLVYFIGGIWYTDSTEGDSGTTVETLTARPRTLSFTVSYDF